MPNFIIYKGKHKHSFRYKEGSLLIDVLRESGFLISAPCGGNGHCGKCLVKLNVNDKEEDVLACQTRVYDDCSVYLPDDSDIVSEGSSVKNISDTINDYGVAIDLGTTTIEISLVDLNDGKRICSNREWNLQRSYGADVISRIDYCINNKDGLQTLSDLVRKQILDMIDRLCSIQGIDRDRITRGFLAGNTVMQHIFCNIDPGSIALAPFTPNCYFIDNETVNLENIPIRLSPCISGYVGGDIVSGLSALNLNKETILYIDIGTNGEMAIGNSESLHTCSVACGPAFEGAEISCGMHATSGAISKVWVEEGRIAYETIDNTEVKGICGSGLIDMVASLLDLNYLDESGYLDEDIDENIFINQMDIRKLQLAKAAIASGIKTLMNAVGLTYNDIDKLYIAGSFGNNLNLNSAARIGMIPRELINKTILCGNNCLSGVEAELYKKEDNKLLNIKKISNYIELSSSKEFSDFFVEEMAFPEV